MSENQLSCLWNAPSLDPQCRAAVSLHSHTNHSKESLYFIPAFARRHPLLHWALQRQCRRSTVPVDLDRAYWTPPLTARAAYGVEKRQIEDKLGLAGLVSLTDHDTIEAPTVLRVVPETSHIPFSLEWSVPFEGAMFHLGVHNLPPARAQEIVVQLAAYTASPAPQDLSGLLAMLDENPGVLIVLNHPLWDLCRTGMEPHRKSLEHFLHNHIEFLHAFELNGTRSRAENNSVMELAGQRQRLIISGGDRHGCEPSAALNLTRAESFCEFVHEIRVEQRSHVLFMPQYAEPLCVRTIQTLLDVISDYPEYSEGCRRWDERVFYPDPVTMLDRPVSSYWNAPPAFLNRIFFGIRLLDNASVRRALRQMFKNKVDLRLPSETVYEASL